MAKRGGRREHFVFGRQSDEMTINWERNKSKSGQTSGRHVSMHGQAGVGDVRLWITGVAAHGCGIDFLQRRG